MLTDTKYQTWKVIHGYSVFPAFVNFFFGYCIDRLNLTRRQKEIASWSFVIAGLAGSIGRSVLTGHRRYCLPACGTRRYPGRTHRGQPQDVVGRPFQFYGVPWGWGLIITSVIFGLMHVINIGGLVNGNWQLATWWGLWTFFGGLVLGFVREKSGSILAPSILHGLPQALSNAFDF